MAWAWPVFDTTGKAYQLEYDGTAFSVPEELAGVGPLIVDAQENAGALFAIRPAQPSQGSTIVDQPGFWLPKDSPLDSLSLVINGQKTLTEATAEQVALEPERLAVLWQIRLRLESWGQVRGIGEYASRIDQILRGLIRLQPRAMLEGLGLTPHKFTDKLGFFIEFGLANHQFATQDTEGEFHSEPWISLLLELEDLKLLRSTGRLDTSEASDSIAHVESIGGEELVSVAREGWRGWDGFEYIGPTEHAMFTNNPTGFIDMLQSNIPPIPQPWGSSTRRREALVELVKTHDKIDASGIMNHLMPAADEAYRELRLSGLEASMLEMLHRQSTTNQAGSGDPWLNVPFTSAALAAQARLAARGLISQEPSRQTLIEWSELAKMSPQLVLSDIITADAYAINLTKK